MRRARTARCSIMRRIIRPAPARGKRRAPQSGRPRATKRISRATIPAAAWSGTAARCRSSSDRLYECWLPGLDFRVPDAGAELGITGIAIGDGAVSLPIQFVRKAPLGRINGMLHFYGARDPAAGFLRSPIDDVSVSFGENEDPSFDIDPNTVPATGVVTQTATAAINTAVVTTPFFKAVIEVERPDPEEEPPPPVASAPGSPGVLEDVPAGAGARPRIFVTLRPGFV